MLNHSIKNILVSLDLSDISTNVLETAVSIAKEHHANILFLNVVEIGFMFEMGGGSYISPRTIDRLTDLSRKRLNSFAIDIGKRHQIDCVSIVRVGLVPVSIIKAASDYKVDLIIMGKSETSRLKRFFISSTVRRVVKISSCPILTIPPNNGCTNSGTALIAFSSIAGIPERYDSLLKLMGKRGKSLEIMVLSSSFTDAEIKVLKKIAKCLVKKSEQEGAQVSGRLAFGSKAGLEILKRGIAIHAELIVVLVGSDGSFNPAFIDTSLKYVLNYTSVPVLTIPAMINSTLDIVAEPVHELLPGEIHLI